ncbi:MAG TPA: hypothetical protein PLC42_02290 [Parachlamydiaceae bacterium]|nr:hypothetical protein [Parachlamydiaceae bacterium]
MKKTLVFCLLSLPYAFSAVIAEDSVNTPSAAEKTAKTSHLTAGVLPQTFTEEEEDDWITDRDRGSRERPNLYDYNRQNVQYNKRYREDDNRNSYHYNQSSREDTFNRSYYHDNTSPDLYLNR